MSNSKLDLSHSGENGTSNVDDDDEEEVKCSSSSSSSSSCSSSGGGMDRYEREAHAPEGLSLPVRALSSSNARGVAFLPVSGGRRLLVQATHLVAAATTASTMSTDSPKILLVRNRKNTSTQVAQVITSPASSSAPSSTSSSKTTCSTHLESLSTPVVAATAAQQLLEDGTITVTVGSNAMIDASDFHRSMESGVSYSSLGRGSPTHHHHHHHHQPPPSCYAASSTSSSYATLTPLQPLPPISTIPSMQDKFQAYSPGSSNNHQGGPPPPPNNNVVVGASSFVMQNHHLSLGSPYHSYDSKLPPIGMSPPPHFHNMTGMGGHHSPGALSPNNGSNESPYAQNNGGGLHSKQEPLSPSNYYEPGGGRHNGNSPHDLSPSSLDHSPPSGNPMYSSGGPPLTSNNNPSLNGMVSPQTISPHTSPTGLGSQLRELSSSSSPPPPNGGGLHAQQPTIITPVHIQNSHHGNSSSTPMMPIKSSPANNNNSSSSSSSSSSGETEEINTKDLAQRISAELKRYSIPQAIFAQRVLCRSQGTLSDLLRNPKPWSKLKSGRETFRRMQKWLSEPEFQRMSALRLAVMQQSATEKERGRSGESHHSSATNKNRRKLPYNSCPPSHCSVQEERRLIPRAVACPQETPFGIYGPPAPYPSGYF